MDVIGSLYQYFPTKDAVTITLIERESFDLVREASEALQGPDHRRAVRDLVELSQPLPAAPAATGPGCEGSF
ncbi:hypothetical protein [Massilia sp. CCM 8734]|uniref:hypothetical protein n=1 Tax=Massilia sp. CCM 8734 TaxID=2609283 RepID=UPI00142276A0|nr:hypothetical protein [Massilia sp. CCM 8734]NHZ99584.1 hypothetical protein [Massilia sp. CCM 8734]